MSESQSHNLNRIIYAALCGLLVLASGLLKWNLSSTQEVLVKVSAIDAAVAIGKEKDSEHEREMIELRTRVTQVEKDVIELRARISKP